MPSKTEPTVSLSAGELSGLHCCARSLRLVGKPRIGVARRFDDSRRRSGCSLLFLDPGFDGQTRGEARTTVRWDRRPACQ